MRAVLGLVAAVGLVSACMSPPIPDSGAGVGFGDYDTYRAGDIAPRTPPISSETPSPAALEPAAPPLGAPARAPGTEVTTTALDPVQPGPGSTAGPLLSQNNPGISSEQDFDAVSAERDIAADAERIAAARQQYQLVTPTELQRPNDTGPNIIDFALSSTNPVGNKVYRRNPFGAGRAAEKCAGYRTADVAQEEFLSAGGPERDRLGLDPDGDGYACGWNPATYRNLVRN